MLADRPVDPEQPLASPSTLWRLEDRADKKALARMIGVLVETFIRSHATPPEALVLDFDATDLPIHGE
jgi:hypothetical protein